MKTKRNRIRVSADEIADMRFAGMNDEQIGAQLGVPRSTVANFRWRKRVPATGVTLKKPTGRVEVLSSFTAEQLRHLDARAAFYGCDDIAELVVEMVRDVLAEEMQVAAE